MTNWDGLNRRKFPRVNYPCLIVISGEAADGSEVVLTHTENIGIGGACVVLKNKLKMFSEIELELDLLDLGEHIKCGGKIVWCIQRGSDAEKKPLFFDTGIEFVGISPEDQERLKAIVERLVKKNEKTVYAD